MRLELCGVLLCVNQGVWIFFIQKVKMSGEYSLMLLVKKLNGMDHIHPVYKQFL